MMGSRQDDGLTPDTGFSWHSTHASAARLIASAVNPGLVVDFGAGAGSLGDAIELFGMAYLGLDGDADNVAAMVTDGKDAVLVDLIADDAANSVLAVLDEMEGPVVALTMLDVIEHLPDPAASVSKLGEIVDRIAERQNGVAPLLVLSVPNVAHYDVGAKLMLGRWDVTTAGLLDDRNLSFFTEYRLDDIMERSGFSEVGRSDILLDVTEQRSQRDTPVFEQTTLASYLRTLRAKSGEASQTYRFVRSYERAPSLLADSKPETDGPFISVIVRTQGNRDSLVDTLTSLAAQRDDDLEALVMVHHDDPDVVDAVSEVASRFAPSFNVRVHHVTGGGRSAPLNAALKVTSGRYVSILDDDDMVTPDWVAAFRRAADRLPGRMVRAACVVQWIEPSDDGLIDFEPVSGFESMYPTRFDFVDTVRANRSPTCCYASPMGVVRALRLEFDESLSVCEDWKFELQVASAAGVADDPAVTSIYRRWRRDGGSAVASDDETWINGHERVIDDLDDTPTIFPAGSLRRVHELYRYIEQLETELGRRDPDAFPFSAQSNISE
jgi:glycosyltransferase involved in cell wall biosynthesis